MKNKISARIIVLTIASALVMGGCASTQTASAPTPAEVVGGMQGADAKSQECVTASIVGGLLGGMMAEGTNTAKGAAAGAGIAMLGCVALKANAREEKEKAEKSKTEPAKPATPIPPASTSTPSDVKSLN
jgi:PBP1b-binding outer membrane lipoprotein LpoB